MAETVTPLLQVMLEQHCDSCGGGVMRPVKKPGALSLVNTRPEAAGIVHVCSACGQQSTYRISYPEIKYVDFMDFIRDSQAVLDQLKQEVRDGRH